MAKRSADAGANAFIGKKGINNIISAIHAAQNGYSYFPFSLSGFVGSLSNEAGDAAVALQPEVKVMRAILNGARQYANRLRDAYQ